MTPAARQIIEQEAQRYGVPFDEVVSGRRFKRLTVPKHAAIYRIRKELTPRNPVAYSLPAIGRFFGMKDHTSVIHAIKAHQARMEAAQ